MTFTEAERLLQRVSYHNMTFAMRRSLDGGFELRIMHYVNDSDEPEKIPQWLTQRQGFHLKLLSNMDEAQFFRWVWHHVKGRVMHEAAEFFRIDGIAPHHPHRKREEANVTSNK